LAPENQAPLFSKMEKFIVVNGRILDFSKYRDDFLLLQKLIALDLKEYFLKLGFKSSSAKNKKLLRQKLKFYNEGLDLEINVLADKKGRMDFV